MTLFETKNTPGLLLPDGVWELPTKVSLNWLLS